MSYTVENLEKSMAKITITVSAEAFEEAMVKSYNKNKKNISIQGFRKGKAPRKMVEKLYGPEVFYEDAANFAIPDAYEEAAKESCLLRGSSSFSLKILSSSKMFFAAGA